MNKLQQKITKAAKLSMDALDLQICALLQQNGRINLSTVAENTGVSIGTVRERIRKLEERGIIQQYSVLLNPKSFGYDITAFILVTVEGSQYYPQFIKHCKAHPEILECHAITGEASHILKVRTTNTATLEQLLSTIQKWKGVKKTFTSLVLSTHKESIILPRFQQEGKTE